jgi:hypothetical protein
LGLFWLGVTLEDGFPKGRKLSFSNSNSGSRVRVSNDPRFAEKLEDIVDLYLAAPEHALVLSCDEKSASLKE